MKNPMETPVMPATDQARASVITGSGIHNKINVSRPRLRNLEIGIIEADALSPTTQICLFAQFCASPVRFPIRGRIPNNLGKCSDFFRKLHWFLLQVAAIQQVSDSRR